MKKETNQRSDFPPSAAQLAWHETVNEQPPATDETKCEKCGRVKYGDHGKTCYYCQPPATEQEWMSRGVVGEGGLNPHIRITVSEREQIVAELDAEREKLKARDLLIKQLEQDVEAKERRCNETYQQLLIMTNQCVQLRQELNAARAAIAAYIKSNYNELGDNFAVL
jgi:hypothetical protein